MNPIQIDIVSDVACPWCYIGKKHLEKALEQVSHKNFQINWHPFQLDPTIPAEGYEREEYFEKKFGSTERSKLLHEHVINAGTRAGIGFRFEAMKRIINTFPLHKILYVAGQEGFQNELEERFFSAMFTEATDLSITQNLYNLMTEYGWPSEKVDAILEDDTIDYAVKQEIGYYQNLGISGVPFFILNNKYGFSGAQPVEVFIDSIYKVAQEMQPIKSQGDTCAIDGSDC